MDEWNKINNYMLHKSIDYQKSHGGPKITLQGLATTVNGLTTTVEGLAKTVENLAKEMRQGFKAINDRLDNIVKLNNLKEHE